MPKNEWLRLRHMLEAAEEAVAFTAQRQRWEVIQKDLPPLIEHLKSIIPSSNL